MPVFSSLAVPADIAPSPLSDFSVVRRTFTHSLLHLSAVPHAGETEAEGRGHHPVRVRGGHVNGQWTRGIWGWHGLEERVAGRGVRRQSFSLLTLGVHGGVSKGE